MKSKKSTILIRKDNLRIVRFKSCNHIGFMYKNLLLNFNITGFQQFTESFQQLNFDRRAVSFPDGTTRMVMKTCRQEIQLCFQKDEFEMVREALQEAVVMLEVNQILYSEQEN
ncbi:hypothetical protein NC796_08605 [Aliifodinibius sp. S!AR15-10]|uniref:DUF6686 family protein n=1 Tax=Aliifodinibius sp. S!AR15-10 TaxID=2950437 RepID=UPI002856DE47|nr:DUF6686 family protein [Aliifodinibius sp. S!AR15-10]MDR8391195.1 hypothetical protein [Aliifodinibius sp. S!AR15-10]